MGLFSKKELCPVCGKKIKGDVLVRIKDNIPLCRECSAMVNMDAALIPCQSVEEMKAHLAYRARNLDRFIRFETTWEAKAGTSLFCVDEAQKVWYCTRNRKDKNPPIFEYGEFVGVQYLEDGQPVVGEEKKGVFGSLFGGKKEPVMLHSMKVRIDLDNPYTKQIDIETIGLNEEVKTGSMPYKSKRRSLDKILEALKGMTGDEQETTVASSVNLEDSVKEAVECEATGPDGETELTGEESEQEIIEKYDNI